MGMKYYLAEHTRSGFFRVTKTPVVILAANETRAKSICLEIQVTLIRQINEYHPLSKL